MENRRFFNISDPQFFEYADVMMATLPTDLPDFTAFDTTITADYVSQIQQAIEDARAVPRDSVVIDEMGEETQKVKKALKDCYDDYQALSYFIRKAFKGNPAVQNQFGKNDIREARSSQPKMVVFMDSLVATVSKYSAELVQAGCPQELIDGLAAKAATLRDSNIGQEKFKKDRGLSTQTRIELMNNVYELLKPLQEIASIIYRDNPQKLKIYTFPKPPKKASSTPKSPETPESPSDG
jgi:hypothetical protein